MTDAPNISSDSPFPENNYRRRDLIIAGLIFLTVIIGFYFTGGLTAVDAGLAWLVTVFAGLAYYIGSSPRRVAGPVELAKVSKPNARLNILLEETINAISHPALLIDPNKRVSAFNKDAETLFRIRGPAGGTVQSVFRDPEILEAIDYARVNRTSTQVELTRKRDFEQVWQCDLAFIEQADSVMIIASDLSAVKRAERARADFLANASHELRTPLTSIAGFIETMQGPAADDKDSWDRFLSIMHDQTDRMRRLIADLLSLSRIELNEHTRSAEHQDLQAITRDAVDAMQVMAGEKDLQLDFTQDQTVPPVIAVRDELMQVIQNLTDNAMKYAPKGSTVSVRLGVSPTSEAARTACSRQWGSASRIAICSPATQQQASTVWLRVIDQGPGIDPIHLPRLGERFYRADKSRGGSITGTGLGLAIVKHIMNRHSGGLAVESHPGTGTAFGIWLSASEDGKTL